MPKNNDAIEFGIDDSSVVDSSQPIVGLKLPPLPERPREKGK